MVTNACLAHDKLKTKWLVFMEFKNKRIFVNSLHSIIVTVMLISLACYFLLGYYDLILSKSSLAWCLTFIIFPIATLFQSMTALNAAGEMKELTTPECNRLNYILTVRGKMIRNSMVFYFVAAVISGILIWLDVDTRYTFSFAVSVLCAGVLSIAGAIQDNIEASQFKRKIINRSKEEAEAERIAKKIKDASK